MSASPRRISNLLRIAKQSPPGPAPVGFPTATLYRHALVVTVNGELRNFYCDIYRIVQLKKLSDTERYRPFMSVFKSDELQYLVPAPTRCAAD